jgi:hypothetical protein
MRINILFVLVDLTNNVVTYLYIEKGVPKELVFP